MLISYKKNYYSTIVPNSELSVFKYFENRVVFSYNRFCSTYVLNEINIDAFKQNYIYKFREVRKSTNLKKQRLLTRLIVSKLGLFKTLSSVLHFHFILVKSSFKI